MAESDNVTPTKRHWKPNPYNMRFVLGITIALTLFCISAAAQTPCKDFAVNEKGDTIFNLAEKTPNPKDGLELYRACILNNADRKLMPVEKTSKAKWYS